MKREAVVAAVLAVGALGGIVAVSLLGGGGDVEVTPSPATGTGTPSSVAPKGTGATSGSSTPVVEPEPRKPGVAGRVLDGKTDQPLAGLKFHVRLTRGTRTETREVTADDDGGFWLAGIPDGEYRVTFEHPAFFPVETEVSLGKESEPARLEVVFERGVTVRGSVNVIGGGSPGGALIEWVAIDDPAFVREAVSTPQGTYELGGLEPGRYWVRVMPRVLAALWRSAKPEEVRLDDVPEATRNLKANLGASLVVRVTRDGDPVGGVAVRFTIESKGRGIAGFLDATDTDGSTALHGLPRTGTLELEVPPGPHGGARRDEDLSRLARTISLELEEEA